MTAAAAAVACCAGFLTDIFGMSVMALNPVPDSLPNTVLQYTAAVVGHHFPVGFQVEEAELLHTHRPLRRRRTSRPGLPSTCRPPPLNQTCREVGMFLSGETEGCNLRPVAKQQLLLR